MRPNQSITLYGVPLSGHSHRAELMLRLLGLPFEFRAIDLKNGEQKQDWYLRLNSFGTVPVIDDGGVVIADSAAILVYLASKYDAARTWLPADPAQAAQVQRWLSAAQGLVAFGPALARFIQVFGAKRDLVRAQEIATNLFGVLNTELSSREFLVDAAPTIADVALYSYVAHAPEGGIALEPYPAIQAWLARIETLPGFVDMPKP